MELIDPWSVGDDALATKLASNLSDSQFIELFKSFKPFAWARFEGQFFTLENQKIMEENSWRKLQHKLDSLESRHGKALLLVLRSLLKKIEASNAELYSSTAEAGYKGPMNTIQQILEELASAGIIEQSYAGIKYAEWRIPDEIIPLIRNRFRKASTYRGETQTVTQHQKTTFPISKVDPLLEEVEQIRQMDQLFDSYLTSLVKHRLNQTVNFGKNLFIKDWVQYLQDLFGRTLYFDSLLAIAQQYGLTDVDIVHNHEKTGFKTGFNLSLFGEPGTGKSFATRDLILGNPKSRIPPHGIPGRNRYAGGMTPARFIRIGQGYEGRIFNFIVPEFNDWFKYKGMVEPLKLAMERGELRYETFRESIGPYRFSSFFTVNYNTEVSGTSYETTISDPNFEAIEDRMLCRLHRLTKERFVEIARGQMRLAYSEQDLGSNAELFRDHLTLVYAIGTQHPLVATRFPKKEISLTSKAAELLEKTRNEILANLPTGSVPFSARLEERVIRLAGSMTLIEYFRTKQDDVPLSDEALQFALRFYVEEAAIRAKGSFNPDIVLAKLGF